MDEPLALLAATHWINANHRTSCKFFTKQLHLNDPASNGFENYIAFCIDMIFSSEQKRIDELFLSVGTPPPWGSVCHFAFSRPSLALGMNAKTPKEITTWLNQRSHSQLTRWVPTSFCASTRGRVDYLCRTSGKASIREERISYKTVS